MTGQDIISNQSAKIYLFCCSSSFDASELLRSCGEPGDNLKVIPLPCSGKIDFLYLIKAFENGADGVAVLVCKNGECRYLEGNLRARKRVEAVNTLLEELGMDKGHIVLIQMNDDGIEQVIREVDNFRTRIKTLSRTCRLQKF